MNKNITKRSLKDLVNELPKEIEPDRELWSGIEKALANTSQDKSTPKINSNYMALAASITAAVLLTWFSFKPSVIEPAGVLNLASVMKQNFEEQKQLVLTSYGQPEITKLPQDMQDELNELSAARTAISNALKNDPNNSELLNLLRWTQQQEIDLLKQLFSPQWQTI